MITPSSYVPFSRLRVGENSVLLVEEEGFEDVSSAEFRVEFSSALHALLNKSLDFSGGSVVPTVKRELVGAEPRRLKTMGVAWTWSFEPRSRAGIRLLQFGEEQNTFREMQTLACTLVIKCHKKKEKEREKLE